MQTRGWPGGLAGPKSGEQIKTNFNSPYPSLGVRFRVLLQPNHNIYHPVYELTELMEAMTVLYTHSLIAVICVKESYYLSESQLSQIWRNRQNTGLFRLKHDLVSAVLSCPLRKNFHESTQKSRGCSL